MWLGKSLQTIRKVQSRALVQSVEQSSMYFGVAVLVKMNQVAYIFGACRVKKAA
jgi:hypothetical protein